jgi:hypothetical protein
VQRSEKMVGEVESIHEVTLELFKHLTKEIRANWATIGLGFGMALEFAIMESLPPTPLYVHFVVFAVLAGVIQALLRWDWKWVAKLLKKTSAPSESKPVDK